MPDTVTKPSCLMQMEVSWQMKACCIVPQPPGAVSYTKQLLTYSRPPLNQLTNAPIPVTVHALCTSPDFASLYRKPIAMCVLPLR